VHYDELGLVTGSSGYVNDDGDNFSYYASDDCENAYIITWFTTKSVPVKNDSGVIVGYVELDHQPASARVTLDTFDSTATKLWTGTEWLTKQ